MSDEKHLQKSGSDRQAPEDQPESNSSSSTSSKKHKSILWNVSIFILFMEMCERTAFYGFSGTLIEFLLSLHNDQTFAAQMVSLFAALVYIFPIFGGFVADQYLNRYRTILVFGVIYMIGLVLAVVSADTYLSGYDKTATMLVGLLVFVALGAGGIKANCVTFGADQFDTSIPHQKKEQDSFFNYFYWVINIGALLAYGYIANLSFDPMEFSGGVVPREMGYFVSYLIPLAVLCVALVVYVLGTPRYKIQPATESAFTGFVKIFVNVCTNTAIRGKLVLGMIAGMIFAIIITIASYFAGENAANVAYASMGMIFATSIALIVLCKNVQWTECYLQTKSIDSNSLNTLRNVEDTLLLLPYFCILIIFWIAYIQMSTNFQLQGCQMNMNIQGVVLSPAFFNVFDCVAIIVSIPIVDSCVYPWAEKKIGRRVRAMDKLLVGFLMTCLAMVVAGLLEIARKSAGDLAEANGFEEGVASCCAGCSWNDDDTGGNCAWEKFCGNETTTQTVNGVNTTVPAFVTCAYNSFCVAGDIKPMKDITIFYQIIPYAFVGLGEVFTAIPAYDLFYNEVGPEIRSVAQALNLLSTSMGAFAAGGFVSMFSGWLPTNLNTAGAHVEYIFFIIAALCFLAFLVLKWLQSSYTYRDSRIYVISAVLPTSQSSSTNSNSTDAPKSPTMPEKRSSSFYVSKV